MVYSVSVMVNEQRINIKLLLVIEGLMKLRETTSEDQIIQLLGILTSFDLDTKSCSVMI